MKKLRLESLEVTSFETLSSVPQERGTVQGHAIVPRPPLPGASDGPLTLCNACGPSTPYYDCTFTCTQFLDCDPSIVAP